MVFAESKVVVFAFAFIVVLLVVAKESTRFVPKISWHLLSLFFKYDWILHESDRSSKTQPNSVRSKTFSFVRRFENSNIQISKSSFHIFRWFSTIILSITITGKSEENIGFDLYLGNEISSTNTQTLILVLKSLYIIVAATIVLKLSSKTWKRLLQWLETITRQTLMSQPSQRN